MEIKIVGSMFSCCYARDWIWVPAKKHAGTGLEELLVLVKGNNVGPSNNVEFRL